MSERGEATKSPGTTRHAAVGARTVDVGDHDGQRIDNFLMRELPGVPRSRVYRMLRRGEVRVNGGRVRATHRLVRGDRVRIPPVAPADAASPRPRVPSSGLLARLEAAIRYEDDSLLLLDKPAGLAVHGGSGVSLGVIEALRQIRPATSLELVHRLDRDTSGCLLLAKTRSALLEAHAALRSGQARKGYQALVAGAWPRRRRTVQLPLLRYHTASGERRVRVADDGKASRTDFEILQRGPLATRLRAFPHTGRTHQIRVHAAASGHAILGDEKYQPEAAARLAQTAAIRRLCLHAETLSLEIGGRRHRFCCEPPEDFEAAWERLCRCAEGA